MSVSHFGPDGEWTIRTRLDETETYYAEVEIRFTDRHGERYLDLQRVCEWLARAGWPPVFPSVPLGGIRVLSEFLPPADVGMVSSPGVELWRVRSVEAWRDACLANRKPTTPPPPV